METTPLDILLLDAQYRQTLASLRAYGRAGRRAGAVACASEAHWAPALRSRWCRFVAEVPDFSLDPDAFVDALLGVVKQTQARLVVPAHDGSIEALRARREEFETYTMLALAGEDELLDVAVSKTATLALAANLGVAVPRSIEVDSFDDVPSVMSEIGLPGVVKPEQSWAVAVQLGSRLSPVVVTTVDAAKDALADVFEAGGRAIVQEWLPGRREAVSLFYAEGRIWARLAQMSHREWPVLGGVSVLCETIALSEDIVRPAEDLVRAMGLEGCSMVEYRRDPAGRPVLMEVNPRMGGSVGLAISCGVDFPGLLAAWKLGEPLHEVGGYPIGRRLRWLSGDVWHLKCAYECHGQPDVPPRGLSTGRFVTDFFRPSNSLDVIDRTDLRPGLVEINHVVLNRAKGRLRRPSRRARPEGMRGLPPMDSPSVDVVIIGAGPNGLGLASFLTRSGVSHRIFGSPMKTWRDMPSGMNLKSLGFATSIPDPDGTFTFPAYCRANGLEDYEPIEFATFAEYGMEFQRRFVPEVEETMVTNVTRARDQFAVTLETGETVQARNVIVAIGLTYFARVPDVFGELPADRVEHTWGPKDYSSYAGQDVVVVGAGSSAIETATVLHESGARVQVVARGEVYWGNRTPPDSQRALIDRVKLPVTSLGHGRENWVLEHFPSLLHYFPASKRIPFTRRHLGPVTAWWLRERSQDVFPIMNHTSVEKAAFAAGKVELRLMGPDQEVRTVLADRVMLGTGYDFDLSRTRFLGRQLRSDIRRHEMAPKLSRNFESSVPGLYFVGPIAAESFGPLLRFVASAPYSVPRVARRLAKHAGGRVSARRRGA